MHIILGVQNQKLPVSCFWFKKAERVFFTAWEAVAGFCDTNDVSCVRRLRDMPHAHNPVQICTCRCELLAKHQPDIRYFFAKCSCIFWYQRKIMHIVTWPDTVNRKSSREISLCLDLWVVHNTSWWIFPKYHWTIGQYFKPSSEQVDHMFGLGMPRVLFQEYVETRLFDIFYEWILTEFWPLMFSKRLVGNTVKECIMYPKLSTCIHREVFIPPNQGVVPYQTERWDELVFVLTIVSPFISLPNLLCPYFQNRGYWQTLQNFKNDIIFLCFWRSDGEQISVFRTMAEPPIFADLCPNATMLVSAGIYVASCRQPLQVITTEALWKSGASLTHGTSRCVFLSEQTATKFAWNMNRMISGRKILFQYFPVFFSGMWVLGAGFFLEWSCASPTLTKDHPDHPAKNGFSKNPRIEKGLLWTALFPWIVLVL